MSDGRRCRRKLKRMSWSRIRYPSGNCASIVVEDDTIQYNNNINICPYNIKHNTQYKSHNCYCMSVYMFVFNLCDTLWPFSYLIPCFCTNEDYFLSLAKLKKYWFVRILKVDYCCEIILAFIKERLSFSAASVTVVWILAGVWCR